MCRKPSPKGRAKEYEEKSISQVCCWRCGTKSARYQWSICSLDNRWFPICEDCDVELNDLVLVFAGFTPDNRRQLIDRYKEKVYAGKHT